VDSDSRLGIRSAAMAATDHVPRFMNHDSPSASIESDAARLFHFSDPVLRVWTSVGPHRQRGRKSARLLPSARGAQLRHDRNDARRGIRQDADGVCTANLPRLSGTGRVVYRSRSGVDGCGSRRAGSAGSGPDCACGLRGARNHTYAHPRRARTSRCGSQLNLPSTNCVHSPCPDFEER